MLDLSRLKEMERRFEELEHSLCNPEVLSNPAEYQKLSKERKSIEEVARRSKELGETVEHIAENQKALTHESDNEMRELYERLMATTTEADFNEVLSQIKQAIADGKGANHDEITVAIPGRPVWRDGSIVWLGGSNPLDVDQQSPRPGSLSCETELVVCYRVKISDAELAARRVEEEARGKKAFTPPFRKREVSKALRAYGKMVSSADKGGVRIVED